MLIMLLAEVFGLPEKYLQVIPVTQMNHEWMNDHVKLSVFHTNLDLSVEVY